MSATGDKVSFLPSPKIFCQKSKSHSITQPPSSDVSPVVPHILVNALELTDLRLGCRVLVGGVKEGILRFMGKVHFIEGDWCGIELDEPEGLHDGVVEQVRYFTCKNGHGIFAPRGKVTAAPDQKSSQKKSQNQGRKVGGDAVACFQPKHSEHFETADASVPKNDGVCLSSPHDRPQKPSKLIRPKPVSSSDVESKENSVNSKLPRPKSAVVSSSQAVPSQNEGLHMRRSSLVDFSQISKERHQGTVSKRVTFDDNLEYELSSRLSNRLYHSDFPTEGYASDEGYYYGARHRASIDPYTALTLTYGLESSPPRKKSRPVLRMEDIKMPFEKLVGVTKPGQPKSIHTASNKERVIAAAEFDNYRQATIEGLSLDPFENMEEEISKIPTPDANDFQMMITDSLTGSDEDARRMFSQDSPKHSVASNRRPRLAPECSVKSSDEVIPSSKDKGKDDPRKESLGSTGQPKDDLPEKNREISALIQEFPPRPRIKTAPAMISGEIQAVTKKASFELARTALAQYADLIRAAQEETNLRMAKASAKPKPPVCQLDQSTVEFSAGLSTTNKSKDETDKTADDAELSGSVDSLNFETSVSNNGFDEYEMFEGEDLRTIRPDDVLIGSEDDDDPDIGGRSEDISAARRLSDELDLDDSMNIETDSVKRDAFQLSVANAVDLSSSSDDLRPTTDADQVSEEDLLNTINRLKQSSTDDVSTLSASVALRRRHARPVSMVSTASSDAGIVEDLLPGFGARHERPISLISSTSSTDTGCPMEMDSEMMSSVLFSSTLDDLAESWQEASPSATRWIGHTEIPDPGVMSQSVCQHELDSAAMPRNDEDLNVKNETGLVENPLPVDGREPDRVKDSYKDQNEAGRDHGGGGGGEIVAGSDNRLEIDSSRLPDRSFSDGDGMDTRFEESPGKVATDAVQGFQMVEPPRQTEIADNVDWLNISADSYRAVSADGKLQDADEIIGIINAQTVTEVDEKPRDDAAEMIKLNEKRRDDAVKMIEQDEKRRDDAVKRIEQDEKRRDDAVKMIEQDEKRRDDAAEMIEQDEKRRDDATKMIEQDEKWRDDAAEMIEQDEKLTDEAAEMIEQDEKLTDEAAEMIEHDEVRDPELVKAESSEATGREENVLSDRVSTLMSKACDDIGRMDSTLDNPQLQASPTVVIDHDERVVDGVVSVDETLPGFSPDSCVPPSELAGSDVERVMRTGLKALPLQPEQNTLSVGNDDQGVLPESITFDTGKISSPTGRSEGEGDFDTNIKTLCQKNYDEADKAHKLKANVLDLSSNVTAKTMQEDDCHDKEQRNADVDQTLEEDHHDSKELILAEATSSILPNINDGSTDENIQLESDILPENPVVKVNSSTSGAQFSTGAECPTGEMVVNENLDGERSYKPQNAVSSQSVSGELLPDSTVLEGKAESDKNKREHSIKVDAKCDDKLKQALVAGQNKAGTSQKMAERTKEKSGNVVEVAEKVEASRKTAANVSGMKLKPKGPLKTVPKDGQSNSVSKTEVTRKKPQKAQDTSALADDKSRPSLEVEGQSTTTTATTSPSEPIALITKPDNKGTPSKNPKDASKKTVRSLISKSAAANTLAGRRKASIDEKPVSPFRAAAIKPPISQRRSSQAPVGREGSLGNPTSGKSNPGHKSGDAAGTVKKKSDEKPSGKPVAMTKTAASFSDEKKPTVAASSKTDSLKAVKASSSLKSGSSMQQSPRNTTRARADAVIGKSALSAPVSSNSSGNRRNSASISEKSVPQKQGKQPSIAKSSRTIPSPSESSRMRLKDDSNSQLISQLEEIKAQLRQTQQQLDEVLKDREALHALTMNLKGQQETEIKGLRMKHQQEIDALKKAFVEQTKGEVDRVVDQHSKEVKTLKSYHERQLGQVKHDHSVVLNTRDKEHKKAIAELEAKHLAEINETKTSHEQQLNEICDRFEEIKISLSTKVEQLRSKCDELCSRELCYKDTCKRETDLREQAALEVDSLRVVLEQKAGEIRKLRQHNAILEEKVQEIPQLKETVSKLQQKIENLEAVNCIKSDHEKQMAEMHQVLLRKFERESKAMKRLSMENEELMWRLSQSDFGPSCLQDKFPDGDNYGSAAMSRSYDGGHQAMTHRTQAGSGSHHATDLMSKSFDGFSDFSSPSAAVAPDQGLLCLPSLDAVNTRTPGVKFRRSGTYDVTEHNIKGKKP